MNNNLVNKTIDWSINAIRSKDLSFANQANCDIKSPNWLFRLLVVCIFIIFYFYFLFCVQKIIPIVYNKCRNKHQDNIEVDKIIQRIKSEN